LTQRTKKEPEDRKGLTTEEGDLDVDVEGDIDSVGFQETTMTGSRPSTKSGGYSQVTTADNDPPEL